MSKRTHRAFDTSWSPSERKCADGFVSRHRKQLRRVERSSGGPRGKHKFEVRRTLESYPARFCAAARVLDCVYRKERKKKPTQKAKDALPRPTFERVSALAKRVTPYHDSKEPMKTGTQAKRGGGQRKITAFRQYRKCQQFLVKDVLSASIASAESRDYAIFEGSKAAIERIVEFEQSEQNGGKDHEYIKADIKRFYDSIAHKGLEAVLPLPVRATQIIVCPNTGTDEGLFPSLENTSHVLGNHTQAGSHKKGLVGLPTGSAASNVVGAYVLQNALADLATREKVVLYADDILVQAANGNAPAIEQELQSRLRDHPAGPFEVKSSICNSKDGFAYLGYYLSVVASKYDGRFRARASYDSRDTFRARLVQKVHFEYTSAARADVATRYLRVWVRSFGAWGLTSRERSYFTLMVRTLCDLMDHYDWHAVDGLNSVDPNRVQWSKGEGGGEWRGPSLG